MHRPTSLLLVMLWALLAVAACSDGASGDPRAPGAGAPPPVPLEAAVPPAVAACAACHAEVVERFTGSHAMARSLGALGELVPGALTNPATGMRYEVLPGERGGLLVGTRADGGRREQQLVGRIGAGRFDTSLVVAERVGGMVGGRLSFAPVEFVSGHGWALSPFELHGQGAGLDQPVTAECLVCHSDTDVRTLPGAAVSVAPVAGSTVFPRNHLGADALAHLDPLGCDTCHGHTARHVALMTARAADAPAPLGPDALGLVGWRDLPLARQRETCARCHLEGEVRVDLGGPRHGLPADGAPALGVRPVLVTAAPDDDYRFVGQVERLALSACFRAAPDMTCVTCHNPHAGVAAQGTASFDRACLRCHGAGGGTSGGRGCTRPPALTVEEVRGAPARSAAGCVDCHVRRSQPYDLGHVVTADHFVRRRIPPPGSAPPRPYHDAAGALALFRDGVVDAVLEGEAGRLWEDGVRAFGLARQGRHREAGALLSRFPAPGSAAARRPTAPAGLTPLETSAAFHGLRGHVLEALGESAAALLAYGDALACDPTDPEARLNRAALRVETGDLAGAVEDAALLLERHPLAEKAWNVNARAAARAGDLRAALTALAQSAERWPVSAAVHHEAGRLLLRLGEPERARAALQRAAALEPSRPGLAEDLAATGR